LKPLPNLRRIERFGLARLGDAEMAAMLGVTKEEFDEWLAVPAFQEALTKGQAKGVLVASATLLASASGQNIAFENLKSAELYLRQHGQRWMPND